MLTPRTTAPTRTLVLALAALVGLGTTASARPTPLPEPALREGLPGALVGSLELTNDRERPVQVYIDGAFVMDLPANTTHVIPNVPNGVRLVSYAGPHGQRWQTDRVEVRIERRAALRIAPLRGFAVVRNAARVPMRVTFGDLDLGLVAPGREVQTPALPAGRYVLSALAQTTNRVKPQVQEVLVRAGDTVAIELRSMTADLTVENPFPHSVNLWLDGRKLMRLERFATTRLSDLEPGRVTVELRRQGERLAVQTFDLTPGADLRWSPQVPRFGELELRNPTQSRVRITLDGQPGFRLDPGQTRLVAQLATGPLSVQVTTPDGRVIVHQTHIAAGERERFEVPFAWVAYESVPVRPHPRGPSY